MPAADTAAARVSRLTGMASSATTAGSASRWFASHELRTPLQAIKGGVELLLAERGSGLSALQVEALGLIAGATAELERSIEMLAELAALDGECAAAVAPHPLGACLAMPAIARLLRPTPRLAAAAELRVLVAPPLIARALHHLRAATAPGEPADPLACDLVAIESDACVLGLASPESSSGNGAVARQLATTLFARGGAILRSDGSMQALLTLRRAARATMY